MRALHHFAAAAIGATALLAAGCYSPKIPNGQLQCAANGACPEGFVCRAGTCWADVPGCGTADRGTTDPYELLTGTWTFTSGLLDIQCSDGSQDQSNLNGQPDQEPAMLSIVQGGTSGLVITYYCAWDASVANGMTVIDPGQSCTSSSSGTDFVWVGETLTVATQDGVTGTAQGHIQATYTDNSVSPVETGTCELTFSGGVCWSP